MLKACFGCGSTAHLIQDCFHWVTRKVQEVREEMDEPEDLQMIAGVDASWVGQGDEQ